MENMGEMVQIRKWALGLVGGVPTLATLVLAFSLGQTRATDRNLMFETPEQRRFVLEKVKDPSVHWTYEKLDARYMPKNEVLIYLTQIQRNQEKIMNELNIK